MERENRGEEEMKGKARRKGERVKERGGEENRERIGKGKVGDKVNGVGVGEKGGQVIRVIG